MYLNTILCVGLPETPTQGVWLSKNLPLGAKVGVDSRLFSKEQWTPLSKSLDSSGHFLVPVDRNLVDIVWEDRPNPPSHIIEPLGIQYTGIYLRFYS